MASLADLALVVALACAVTSCESKQKTPSSSPPPVTAAPKPRKLIQPAARESVIAKVDATVIKSSLRVNRACSHVAFVREEAGKMRVYSYGVGAKVEGASYVGIMRGTPKLSADGTRVVYAAREGDSWLIVDGETTSKARHEGIMTGHPLLSDDGQHIAYAARDGGRWTVTVDGKQGESYEAVLDGSVAVANSGHVAYVVSRAGKQLVVDRSEHAPHDAIIRNTLTFDAAGKHTAYAARDGEKLSVVIDGHASPSYDDIKPESLVFDSSGSSVAFVAKVAGGWQVVEATADKAQAASKTYVDIGGPTLSYSATGTLAFSVERDAKYHLVVGGAVHGPFSAILEECSVFSPAGGRVACAVRRDKGHHLAMVNAGRLEVSKAFNGIMVDSLVFTEDGKHHAYAAQVGGGWRVVTDRGVFPEHACISNGTPVLSTTGKHVAYSACTPEREWLVSVDGQAGQERYAGILTRKFGGGVRFDSESSLHFLAIRDDTLLRVDLTFD